MQCNFVEVYENNHFPTNQLYVVGGKRGERLNRRELQGEGGGEEITWTAAASQLIERPLGR